ncbi:hypothetical protein BVRB_2g042870 [Beta vulgaris subsp. vulgaris]|nr:hypothetical protein BVRB_2g042870 [Beta vulgaris subsp. vulgaris]
MRLTCIHNNSPSITLSSSTSSSSQSHTNLFSSVNPKPSYLSLPRVPLSRSVLTLARRRSNSSRPITSPSKKNKSRKGVDSNKEEDVNEDAFEALFKQLEEDLKADEQLLDDGEDEISEEELAMLERELEEALAEDESISHLLNLTPNDAVEGEEVEEQMEDEVGEDDVDDEEEEEPITLKGWQLRRLAYALKAGRRKTSIKNLAAELCLDRAIVLELLRDPPPKLLMMSATLPDKPKPPIAIPVSEDMPSVPPEVLVPSEVVADDSAPPEPKVETPIHVLQDSWSAQKRLKKVQLETLENVYRRTKRPTNTMISSIVHVTNLPRLKVVKWFEDKRAAEGVPEQQRPFRRSSSESVTAQ